MSELPPATPAEEADAMLDAAALIGAQARRDEEAARAIMAAGNPVLTAMVLAGAVCELVRIMGDDPDDWAKRMSAAALAVTSGGDTPP